MVKPTNVSRLYVFADGVETLSAADNKWNLDADSLVIALGVAGELVPTYDRYRLVKIEEKN